MGSKIKTIPQNYNRKLTTIEKELEFYNQKFKTFNIATSIKFRGTLSSNTINSGLKILQQRYPFLRVNIIKQNNELYFNEKLNQTIPLRVIEKDKDTLWQEILEEELNCQIDSQNNSLLRVTYITSSIDNISELIFLIHHAISDGISGLSLCHTLLEYCQQIIKGKEVKTESLNLMPPIGSLLPLKNSWIFKSQKLLIISKIIFNQLIKTPGLIKSEFNSSIDQQKTRSIHCSLSHLNTSLLVKRCKQEKTRVTPALNAAMLIALQNTLISSDNLKGYINGIIPINLRKLINSKFGNPENLGFLVGNPFITFSLRESDNFWNLARSSQKEIEFYLQKERPFQSLLLSQERINLARQKKEIPAAFLLSNLGKINLKEAYGNLELFEVRMTLSLRSYNPIIIGHFLTFRNILYITFTYTEPLISSQKVEKFVDYFISVVQEAIKE